VKTNVVIQGDVIQVANDLPAKSVQCIITSPPYYNLRDYGIDGQIGLEETPEAFIAKMVDVFRALRRVLRDDGTLWVNLGDSYVNHSIPGGGDPTIGKRNIGKSKYRSTRVENLKPKDLMMMPARVAIALQADGAVDARAMVMIERIKTALLNDYDNWDSIPLHTRHEIELLNSEWEQAHKGGWYLRSEIIWSKPNPMPESATDRPANAHEKVYLLSKKPRYFYDAESVKEKAVDSGTRKRDKTKYASTTDQSKPDSWLIDCNYAESGRNLRNVWTIATHPFAKAHFATYPPKLVEPCIKAGTSERGCCPECGASWVRVVEKSGGTIGKSWHDHNNDREMGLQQMTPADIAKTKDGTYETKTIGWNPSCKCNAGDPVPSVVLDPFGGSCTTAEVALRLNRSFIMIELSEPYCKIGRERILPYLDQFNLKLSP